MEQDLIDESGASRNGADLDPFLTVQDIATALRLNPQTVRNWIARGSLPALKVGRRVRIRRADFEAFLEHARIDFVRLGSGQSLKASAHRPVVFHDGPRRWANTKASPRFARLRPNPAAQSQMKPWI
jgi:excisionase family DNA binding protein